MTATGDDIAGERMLQALLVRNQREYNDNLELMSAITMSVKSERKFALENGRIRERVSSQLKRINELESALSLYKQNPVADIEAAARIKELEAQMMQLQSELTASYRTKFEEARQLVDQKHMNEQQAKEIATLKSQLDSLQQQYKSAELNVQTLTSAIEDKDASLNVFQEENRELQMEVVEMAEKSKTLAKNNEELVQRLMQQSSEHARILNEMTDSLSRQKGKEDGISSDAGQSNDTNPKQHSKKKEREKVVERARQVVDEVVGRNAGSSLLDQFKSQSTSFESIVPTCKLRSFAGHGEEILSLATSQSGQYLATGSLDRTVKLWDCRHVGSIRTLEVATKGISDIHFSPLDDFVLFSSLDSSAYLYSMTTWRRRHALTGHQGAVTAGRILLEQKAVTTSMDRSIRLWDLNSGYIITSKNDVSGILSLDVLPGSFAVTGHANGHLRLWDLKRLDNVSDLVPSNARNQRVVSVVVSPDGTTILMGVKDRVLELYLVDVASCEVIRKFSADGFTSFSVRASSCCWSPDGKWIVAGTEDGRIMLWEASSGKKKHTLTCNADVPVTMVNWHGEGATLFAVDKQRHLIQLGSR